MNRNYLRIQYMSGLYMNTRANKIYPKPVAPVLALLGDIGSIKCPKTIEFIHWTSHKYKQVIWVPGAEEMSGSKVWQDRLDEMEEKVSRIPNVVIGYLRPITINHESGNSYPILATPGWFSRRLSDKNMSSLAEEEKEYATEIIRGIKYRVNTPIVLSYFPVVMNNKNRLSVNLYGKGAQTTSGYFKENSWYGVNRADLATFEYEAFYEFPVDEKKSEATASSSLDDIIMRQLTNKDN